MWSFWGAEQLNHQDRSRAFNALRGSTDIDEIGEGTPGAVASNSVLMNYYAGVAQKYLDRYGANPVTLRWWPSRTGATPQ